MMVRKLSDLMIECMMFMNCSLLRVVTYRTRFRGRGEMLVDLKKGEYSGDVSLDSFFKAFEMNIELQYVIFFGTHGIAISSNS